MIAILALMLSAGSGAAVTSVRVLPADNQTEVVIGVQGQVTVEDFTLSNPERLVVDLSGARQALAADHFSDINRGGVLGMRMSQYAPGVVRVVIDLAHSVQYKLHTGQDGVEISFPNTGGPFEPWTSSGGGTAAAAAPATTTSNAATAASPPAAAPVVARAAPPVPRITTSFNNAPILDVIQTFAAFANRSIVAGKGVSGNVTADINNQPWDQALEAILEAQGYAVTERQSGILQVVQLEDLRNREKTEDLVTRNFQIHYTSVDSIVNAIKPMLTQRGKATTNPSTNTLIVSDVPSVLNRITPLIEQLDVRTPQVTISAKIIFVDRTGLQELGVIYDLKDSQGNQLNSIVPGIEYKNGQPQQTSNDVISLGGNSIAALANARDRIASPSLTVATTLLLGRHSLITFLNALESLQLTDIQASPVVTVLDNRAAHIQVGERTPVRTIDLGATGGGTNGQAFPRATVSYQNTGVILNVTPHVTGNQVLLELHAERSNIATAPSDLGITFQTQESDTQVLVNDGETAVIGGLTVIQKSTSRTGIPFLMDLPVIGPIFGTTHDSERKQDLLIMVTPHIVREGA